MLDFITDEFFFFFTKYLKMKFTSNKLCVTKSVVDLTTKTD